MRKKLFLKVAQINEEFIRRRAVSTSKGETLARELLKDVDEKIHRRKRKYGTRQTVKHRHD